MQPVSSIRSSPFSSLGGNLRYLQDLKTNRLNHHLYPDQTPAKIWPTFSLAQPSSPAEWAKEQPRSTSRRAQPRERSTERSSRLWRRPRVRKPERSLTKTPASTSERRWRCGVRASTSPRAPAPARSLSTESTPEGGWYQNEPCMHTFPVKKFNCHEFSQCLKRRRGVTNFRKEISRCSQNSTK